MGVNDVLRRFGFASGPERWQCANCGTMNDNRYRFCEGCGQEKRREEIEPAEPEFTPAPIARGAVKYCEDCGAPNDEDGLFCAVCGASFQPEMPPEPEVHDEEPYEDEMNFYAPVDEIAPAEPRITIPEHMLHDTKCEPKKDNAHLRKPERR